MTIKQLGGVFGRNPTFNDVTIEGQLTFDGDIDINSDLKVSGDIETTGNVIIATSGKGIDFSATSGTGTSELFDDYEEGVWTPADGSGAGLTFTSPIGRYTKIGNIVWASGFVTYPTTSDGSGITITGLPFNVANNNASSIGALTYKQTADAAIIKAEPNTDDVRVFNSTGSSTTNAQQSAKVLYFGVVYQA